MAAGSPPGSLFVNSLARILEQFASSFSTGSSRPRVESGLLLCKKFLYLWSTMETHSWTSQYCKSTCYQFKSKSNSGSGTYSPLKSWGSHSCHSPQSAIPSSGENQPLGRALMRPKQARSIGSNTQHNTGREKSSAIAIKRNDRVVCFLHRVKISNLYILDLHIRSDFWQQCWHRKSPSLQMSTWNCEYA